MSDNGNKKGALFRDLWARIGRRFKKSDYGVWIEKTPLKGHGRFWSLTFAGLVVFAALYVALLFVFESGMLGRDAQTGSPRAIGSVLTNILAIVVGFATSQWWQVETEVRKKREDAKRVQSKYGDDLMSLSFFTAEIASALTNLPDKSRPKDVKAAKFLITAIVLFFRRRFQQYSNDATELGFHAQDLQREQHHRFQDIANNVNAFLRKFPNQMQNEILATVVPITGFYIAEGGEVKVADLMAAVPPIADDPQNEPKI